MDIWTYGHMDIWTYGHMYICTYVHMYICTYVHMYIFFRGHKLSPKGRTELKIGRSKAKNWVEFHGDLHCSVAPQKTPQKCKNWFILFRIFQLPFFLFGQKFVSKYFRGQKFASNIFAERNARENIFADRRASEMRGVKKRRGRSRRAKRVERSESSEASRAKRVII